MRFSILLVLAGCGAPEPFRLPELEGLERRFAPPGPRPEEPSGPAGLLAKEELSLEEALAVAERMNPALAAERKNVDLATAALWEARLYPNPSALVEFEDYRTKDKATSGKMERTAGLSFPIVLGGRLGAAGNVADREREIAAVRYLWRRREILTDVTRAFFSLLAARQNAELARGSRDLARTLHAAAEERFRLQAVSEMEVLKAAVALAKAEIDLRRGEKEQAVALKALHALLGNMDLPTERFSGALARRFAIPSLEALRGPVAVVHPLLEAARLEKEAAAGGLVLARAERFPDLALTLTAGRDAEDDTVVEGGLSIPLPLWNRNQARIARAQARLEQADLHAQAVRNDLLLRLTDAYRTLTAAQDRAAVYEEDILPRAHKALAQTDEGYRLGRFGYLDLLDAQRTIAEARAAHAAALLDLNLAAADLEKLTGTPLERIR
jgi:cobalt-zinc-cadmium efflux system outer membrane protein